MHAHLASNYFITCNDCRQVYFWQVSFLIARHKPCLSCASFGPQFKLMMHVCFDKQIYRLSRGLSRLEKNCYGYSFSNDDEVFHYGDSLERLEAHNIRLSKENELLKEQLKLKEDALRLHGIQIMSDVIHLLDNHHIECRRHRGK